MGEPLKDPQRRAAEVLREYADMIAEGETVLAVGHPMQGKIDDPEVQAEVDEYRALAAALEADGWIPVNDRLPDDDLTVMIALSGGDEPVWLGWHDAEGWRSVDATPLGDGVTHWRPMLESPNG